MFALLTSEKVRYLAVLSELRPTGLPAPYDFPSSFFNVAHVQSLKSIMAELGLVVSTLSCCSWWCRAACCRWVCVFLSVSCCKIAWVVPIIICLTCAWCSSVATF
jgi:hypothetical protein